MALFKILRNLILTSLSLSAGHLPASDISQILQKPLIIGASVSADFRATSPGKNLALRYTSPDRIKTLAMNGMPGQVLLKGLRPELFKSQSIIIGVDLFFWDSILPNADGSLVAMRNLIDEAKLAGIPIVLGNIPEIIPGFQSQRLTLNQAMQKTCSAYDRCYLLNLSDLFQNIRQSGSLSVGSKRYTFRELLPDGLHIGPAASLYIADMIEKALDT